MRLHWTHKRHPLAINHGDGGVIVVGTAVDVTGAVELGATVDVTGAAELRGPAKERKQTQLRKMSVYEGGRA